MPTSLYSLWLQSLLVSLLGPIAGSAVPRNLCLLDLASYFWEKIFSGEKYLSEFNFILLLVASYTWCYMWCGLSVSVYNLINIFLGSYSLSVMPSCFGRACLLWDIPEDGAPSSSYLISSQYPISSQLNPGRNIPEVLTPCKLRASRTVLGIRGEFCLCGKFTLWLSQSCLPLPSLFDLHLSALGEFRLVNSWDSVRSSVTSRIACFLILKKSTLNSQQCFSLSLALTWRKKKGGARMQCIYT